MKIIVVLFVSVLLPACSWFESTERPEYLDSQSVAMLEIPPNLTIIDDRNELTIPEPANKTSKTVAEQAKDVAPSFSTVRLESQGLLYWVIFDKDANDIWPLMKSFWSREGIELQREDKMLGIMETVWLNEFANKDDSFMSKIFSFSDPEYRDRFKLRMERTVDGKTKVFISHRSHGYYVSGSHEDADIEVRLVYRPSDAELEREMLTRLAVFVGFTEQKVIDWFELYSKVQARAWLSPGEKWIIEMVGNRDFVNSYVKQALARMGAETSEPGDAQQLLVSVNKIVKLTKPQEAITEKDDGMDVSPWFATLFGSENKSDEDEAQDTTPYSISMEKHDGRVWIRISTPAGEEPQSVNAENFRDALLQYLNS